MGIREDYVKQCDYCRKYCSVRELKSGTIGCSTEHIVNSGFESGDFTGWLYYAGVISTSNPHSGTYCFQTDGNGALAIYQNFDSLPLSSITSSSIWVSSDLEDNMGISFITDDEIGHYDFTLATDDSGTWTQFDLAALLSQEDQNGEVPLALGGNLTQIEVYNLNATTLTAVDDLSLITGGPVPYTYLCRQCRHGRFLQVGNIEPVWQGVGEEYDPYRTEDRIEGP